jgi:hypothetical protein
MAGETNEDQAGGAGQPPMPTAVLKMHYQTYLVAFIGWHTVQKAAQAYPVNGDLHWMVSTSLGLHDAANGNPPQRLEDFQEALEYGLGTND